jgi:hypothetical protein
MAHGDAFDRALWIGGWSVPIAADDVALKALNTASGVVTVSIEADVRAHCLWIWVDGRLLGGGFQNFTLIEDALPAVGLSDGLHRQWTADTLPTRQAQYTATEKGYG